MEKSGWAVLWRNTVDWLPDREQDSRAAHKPVSYSRQHGTEGTGLKKLFITWSLGLVPWNRVETVLQGGQGGGSSALWAQPGCQGFACCPRSRSRPLLGVDTCGVWSPGLPLCHCLHPNSRSRYGLSLVTWSPGGAFPAKALGFWTAFCQLYWVGPPARN